MVLRSSEGDRADVGDEDDVGFGFVGRREDDPVLVIAGDGDGPGVDGLEAVAADGGVAGVAGDAGEGFVDAVGELAPGGVGVVLQGAEAVVVFVVEPESGTQTVRRRFMRVSGAARSARTFSMRSGRRRGRASSSETTRAGVRMTVPSHSLVMRYRWCLGC